MESAAAVHRVPPTAEAPQAAIQAGPGLEPPEDAGQRPAGQHGAALVRHWSPTSAEMKYECKAEISSPTKKIGLLWIKTQFSLV